MKRFVLIFILILISNPLFAQAPAIEGNLEIIVEDYDAPIQVIRHYIIINDGRRFALRFVGNPPGLLHSGSRISVTGQVRLPTVEERTIGDNRTGTIEMTQLNVISNYLGSSSSFGILPTLGILVTFTDATQASTSPSAATAVFQSVNVFDQATSQGQSSIDATVVGPFPISQSRTVCDYNTTATLAKAAAQAAGVNLAQYSRIGYLMPSNACTWWGLGSVGGTQAQFWVNGSVTLKVVAHEMGHNYGLYHSNSLDVVSGQQQEYGDCCDMMGQAGSDPFQPFQNRRLGWLDYQVSPITQTISQSGTYEVEPYVVPWGHVLPKALRIPIDTTTNYFVATLRGNVYVYRGNESSGNSAIQLKGGPFRPNLPVGTSWTDALHSIVILPVSATSISVSLNNTPPPPPTCTDPVAVNFGGPLPCVYAPGNNNTFSDNFTQPNGPLNPTNWIVPSGGLVVASNEVRDSTSNSYHIALTQLLSGSNQTGAMDFAFTNHQGTPRFGIVLRYQSSGNYYLLYRQAGGTAVLRVSKFVNGVETILRSISQANPSANTFFRLEGSASGSTLILKLNDVVKITVTDGTYVTGALGFLMGSTGAHVHRGDNFAGSIN